MHPCSSRGCKVAFDLLQFCNPLSCKDASIISHFKVLIKDHNDYCLVKSVLAILGYVIITQSSSILCITYSVGVCYQLLAGNLGSLFQQLFLTCCYETMWESFLLQLCISKKGFQCVNLNSTQMWLRTYLYNLPNRIGFLFYVATVLGTA